MTESRSGGERETHLGRTGDGDDCAEVDAGLFYAGEKEIDGVEPHGDWGRDLAEWPRDGAVGRSIVEIGVKVNGRLVYDGSVFI